MLHQAAAKKCTARNPAGRMLPTTITDESAVACDAAAEESISIPLPTCSRSQLVFKPHTRDGQGDGNPPTISVADNCKEMYSQIRSPEDTLADVSRSQGIMPYGLGRWPQYRASRPEHSKIN